MQTRLNCGRRLIFARSLVSECARMWIRARFCCLNKQPASSLAACVHTHEQRERADVRIRQSRERTSERFHLSGAARIIFTRNRARSGWAAFSIKHSHRYLCVDEFCTRRGGMGIFCIASLCKNIYSGNPVFFHRREKQQRSGSKIHLPLLYVCLVATLLCVRARKIIAFINWENVHLRERSVSWLKLSELDTEWQFPLVVLNENCDACVAIITCGDLHFRRFFFKQIERLKIMLTSMVKICVLKPLMISRAG